MAKTVRNFWIEISASGRKTRIATGPTGKGGAFRAVVKIRDKGEIREAGTLEGNANGILQLCWYPAKNTDPRDLGNRILLVECER